MRLFRTAAAAALLTLAASSANAATCSEGEARHGLWLIHKMEYAAHRLENTAVKNFCPAASKLRVAAGNVDVWMQGHRSCLTTPSLRREARRFHGEVSRMNSSIRRACGK